MVDAPWLDNSEFPPALDGRYRRLSCVKAGESGAAYICEDRRTKRRVVVKVTSDAAEARQLENEFRLLTRIRQTERPMAERFSAPIACDRQGDVSAFVREYISGNTLETLVEGQPGRPGLPRDKAIQYAASALESLIFLHGMNPPVIHRDIKPQNVVVDDAGVCHLIDLDIAREHREGMESDTRVVGTRLTAPPEQFGYRQTDERSDIYSAGVLLRYCLTGEYREEADAALDEDLAAVVRRATRFDPDFRYQRARDMLADLKRLERAEAERPARPRRSSWLAAALAIVLAAGIIAGALALRRGGGVARFREPLIEQAVRAQLDKPEGELTAEDLARVESLHIFGRQLYDDESQIWFLGGDVYVRDDAMRDAGLWAENGGIRSLEDLKRLPNLREACLYRQQISDLSPLADTGVTRLGVGYNPLTDLSPLAGNGDIIYLNVSGLDLRSAEPLLALPNVGILIVSGVPLQSLEGLEALPLSELNLYGVPAEDLEVLARMDGLDTLTLGELDADTVDILAGTGLEWLTVTHATGTPLRALEAIPALKGLYYYTDEPMELDAAPLRFPNLLWTDLKNLRMASLECLGELQKLEILCVYASEFDSCEGLDALPALQTIYCTAAQAAAIRERYPDNGWDLRITE